MTPISPYAGLVIEWRAQAARCRAEGSLVSIAASVTFGTVARQLEAAELHDLDHAATWRQRWEMATGSSGLVIIQRLGDDELAAHYQALRGHRDAVRAREESLEGEMAGCEMEMERRK